MAAITKNPVGGIGSKVTGDALTKLTGKRVFKELGNTTHRYASNPLDSASEDWKKMSGKTDEEGRYLTRPSYTGYRG